VARFDHASFPPEPRLYASFAEVSGRVRRVAIPHDSRAERNEEQRMRIAMVAPPWYDVPPDGYGGTEQLVATLVDSLTERGHEVVLIAAGEDRTDAELLRTFRVTPTGLGGPDSLPIELIHAARAAERLDGLDVDLVHDHSVVGPLLAPYRPVPTVVTVHGPLEGWMRRLYAAMRGVRFIAISDAQRATAPELDWLATVHNGIDVEASPFQERKGDAFLFLGRIDPTKGVLDAIEIARRTGRPLRIAAKASDDAERQYLRDEVEPRLGDGVDYLGDVDRDRKLELLADARAVLFPIHWEEPFGLVMIEAMSCGTPVVAMRRGSVPEVIEDGRTGFVGDSVDDLVDACGRLGELDPSEIRRVCADRFDRTRMTERYEAAYRAASEQAPRAVEPVVPGA
jgi:glycosyltransferase involved in cell wall biosynthesis